MHTHTHTQTQTSLSFVLGIFSQMENSCSHPRHSSDCLRPLTEAEAEQPSFFAAGYFCLARGLDFFFKISYYFEIIFSISQLVLKSVKFHPMYFEKMFTKKKRHFIPIPPVLHSNMSRFIKI